MVLILVLSLFVPQNPQVLLYEFKNITTSMAPVHCPGDYNTLLVDGHFNGVSLRIGIVDRTGCP
jgi:hypothetical protein